MEPMILSEDMLWVTATILWISFSLWNIKKLSDNYEHEDE